MSTARARTILWLGALLLVPLPYVGLVEGSVPVARFLLLGVVTAAYSGFVDGSGVAWTLTAILLLHALVYGLLLRVPAALLARWVPEALRVRFVWGIVLLTFALAVSLPVYRTPFDDVASRTRWPGLFE
ncbi:MAG: hypothetical protein QNK03_01000 [Myxococcota bacterium]|nr:hypothetical protein [Myxococcota bacterium]